MRLFKLLPNTILALLLTGMTFISISQLQAGASNKSGNPYGNGTFFPNSGTFSAIERSSNGFLGVLQFSTTTTNSSANSVTNNTGIATIYVDGRQFTGSAFGSLNGSMIAATYIGNYSFGVLVPTVTTTTNSTNFTFSELTLSNTCSGQFLATLKNSYPNQIFSGQGQTTVVLKDLDTNTFNILTTTKTYNPTVSGSRLTTGSF